MDWRTQALIYYRGLVWHRWHERDKGTCVHILTPHILPIAFTVLSHVHLTHYSHMYTHACIQCKKLTKKPWMNSFFLNNLAKRRGSSKRHKRRPFPSHSNVNNSSHRQRTTLNILTTQLTKQTVPYVLVSLSSKSLSEPETLPKEKFSFVKWLENSKNKAVPNHFLVITEAFDLISQKICPFFLK